MFANILFSVSSLLVISSCILMMWTKNLMHSCVYLLGVLIGVAGLYLTLGADFVAATQIMVYVGGVVILMLFAVMLTGGKDYQSQTQKILNLFPSMGNKYTFMWGVGVAFVFGCTLIYFFRNLFSVIKVIESDDSYTPTIERLGELLVTDHLVAFEISSVLLLGALVGAAIIARPRKERPAFIDDIVDDHHHDEEHH